MITSINEFKNALIVEKVLTTDQNVINAFNTFIQNNAEIIAKRKSLILPQLNKFLTKHNYYAKGSSIEGFWIEDQNGNILMFNQKLFKLMDELRSKAYKYTDTRVDSTHRRGTKTPRIASVPVVNKPAPTPAPASVSYAELKQLMDRNFESGRYYYGYGIEGNENNIQLLVYAGTKRATTFEVLKYALGIRLPQLPAGYEYVDRLPKNFSDQTIDNKELQYAREDSEYIDSEVHMEIHYNIKKI